MRSSLLNSIEQTLADQQLLTPFQVRGAFANHADSLKADFKSIAASGWGPELIPNEDILQSQFPEFLQEQEDAQARLAELQALFAAASEEDVEDTDDTGVLPSSEVKNLKSELKTVNASWEAELKELKSMRGNLFVELNAAGLAPKGKNKGFYCSDGLVVKDPQFDNAQRIVDLCAEHNFASEYLTPLHNAMRAGRQGLERAKVITGYLEIHEALEVAKQSQGSTMRHVTRKELSRFRVYYPQLECNQQGIAKVLDTINQHRDTIKRKTEKEKSKPHARPTDRQSDARKVLHADHYQRLQQEAGL